MFKTSNYCMLLFTHPAVVVLALSYDAIATQKRIGNKQTPKNDAQQR